MYIQEPSRSRITAEQRRIMIDYIKSNREIITGRFAGPDGARHKAKVLAQMAKTLNSTGSGAVKCPEKWLRSFQDWKSDVKKKAAKIAAHARGTGGGPPMAGLSDVERDLVDLIGESAICGHTEVSDPLEGPSNCGPNLPEDPEGEPIPSAGSVPASPEPAPSAPQQAEEPMKEKKRKRRDEDFDDRMVAAMEQQAEAYAEIGRQIGRLADIGIMFFNAWAQHNNIEQNESVVEYIVPNLDG